jgi:hypothetical protein
MPANDDLDAEIQRVQEQVSAAAQKQAALEKATRDPIPLAQARFTVATWVIIAYLASFLGVGVFIAIAGDQAKDSLLVDMMKTLLLPLVTLVLGYYFGSKAE